MNGSRGFLYSRFQSQGLRLLVLAAWIHSSQAQSLVNIDFGVGKTSQKSGLAAAGLQSDDFWNLYRHYEPRYEPGMALVSHGKMTSLRYSDGRDSAISIEVKNAPSVWGNTTGDPMMDTYIFSQDRKPIEITVKNLPQAHYQVFLYGYADADVEPEQHTSFSVISGTQSHGSKTGNDFGNWQADDPWIDGRHFCVFRNVRVEGGAPLVIQASAAGIPVVNGIQILSRGTAPPDWQPEKPEVSEPIIPELILPRINYRGTVIGEVWQGRAELIVTSMTTNQVTAPLFSHEVAVKADSLPPGVFLHTDESNSFITVFQPGEYQLGFDLTATAARSGPWRTIQFDGPPTAMNRLELHSLPTETETEFLTDSRWSQVAPLPSDDEQEQELQPTRVCILDHPRQVSFRWKANLNRDESSTRWNATAASLVDLDPGMGYWNTTWEVHVTRGASEEFSIATPAELRPIKLEAKGLIDWEFLPGEDVGRIRINLAEPVSNAWLLKLECEQALPSSESPVAFAPPQLLGAQRETGTIRFRSNTMDLRLHSQVAMHQVNASDADLMAFRYHERSCSIQASVREKTPRINLGERVEVVVGENLATSQHQVSLEVRHASLHQLRFDIPEGMVVSNVVGKAVDDWTLRENLLEVELHAALLGSTTLTVWLEQLIGTETEQIAIHPIRLHDADRVQSTVGIHHAPGIVLKTASTTQLRPILMDQWERSEQPLHMAYESDQSDWSLVLAINRPTSRVVADVFQLLTIGEGNAGGSATIRFAIFNQGMREIRLRLPDHWTNLEFTGPNVRDRKQENGEWVIGLHEKVWDGYTLVISYEFSFQDSDTSIPIRVPTILGADRQTGHVAVISHPSVELQVQTVTPQLRAKDPLDLPEFGKSLLTRPAVLAFEFSTQGDHGFDLQVGRHSRMEGLEAVVDRAEYTTVLTDSAEMLTRVTYMIKNHSRRYQRLQLPEGSTLWACHVDGESTKVEQDDDWLMVAIPQHANQDATIAVDLVYKEATPEMGNWLPKPFELVAPRTDIPSTYAEWTLYAPASRRVSQFTGNMKAAPGTIYNFREAWRLYTDVYVGILKRGMTLFTFLVILGGGIALLFLAKRTRGWNGVINVVVVTLVLGILAGMLLPALSRAKSKAHKIKTVNNLKNIGLAARIFETDHGRFPANFSEMMDELGTDKILVDSVTGKPLVYVGTGKSSSDSDSILAYSPLYDGTTRLVVRTDGSVTTMKQSVLDAALRRDASLLAQLAAGQVAPSSSRPPRANLETNLATTPSNDADQSAGISNQSPPNRSVRSILVDIPETGLSYQFSKTLNHGKEPLELRMRIMNGKVYRGFLRGAYALLFLAGTLVVWLEWQKKRPRAWLATSGTIIAILSVIGFLIMIRSLHYVLMFGTPVLLLAAILSAIKPLYSLWTRLKGPRPSSTVTPILTLFLLANSGTGVFLHGANNALKPNLPKLPDVTLISAHYEGTATNHSVALQATYRLFCRTPMTRMLLFKEGIAVDAFHATTGQALLTRQPSGIELVIKEPGETQVTMNLFIKTQSAGAFQEFRPTLPTAMCSELYLKLAEREVQVEAPSASSLVRQALPDGLKVEAIYGPSSPPRLKWTSRNQSAMNRKPNLNVHQISLLRFEDSFIHLKSKFRCQMIQGEQTDFPIHIPQGYDIARVLGQGIDHWEFVPSEQDQTLKVTLTSPLADQLDLLVEMTKPLGNLPLEMEISLPSFESANREVGTVGIETLGEHDLIVASLNQWRRIDESRNTDHPLSDHENLTHAFSFSQPGGSARIILKPTLPRVDTKAWNDYSVATGGLNLRTTIQLEVQDAGLFQFQFGLPPALDLVQVQGEGIQQWQILDDDQNRTLEIEFSRRILGTYEVQLEMHQRWDTLPDQLEFQGLNVLQANKQASWLLVRTEPGLALISTTRAGMAEISPGKVRSPHIDLPPPTLAFRSMQTDPSQTPTSVGAEVRKLAPWVTANIIHLHTFHESFIEGLTLIRYDIQDAPVEDLDLRIPETFENIQVLGDNIQSYQKEREGNWNINLREPVMHEFEIQIQWEKDLALSSGGADIPVECIRTMNVRRETGMLVAKVRPPLQITSTRMSGSLTKVNPRFAAQTLGLPLNHKADRRDFEIALAYQYLQPDFEMNWHLARNLDALLLDALADKVSLTTVVAEDGQLIARASYTIRNRGKRHLVLKLPDHTTPWSVFVSNQSLRPGMDNGRLLIPIQGFNEQDSIQTVDVTYAGQVNFPLTGGSLTLESPSIDVPLKEITWEVLLPVGYQYTSQSKTLQQQAFTEYVEEDFSTLEYRRQDVEWRAETRQESLHTLMEARYALSDGALGKAVQILSLEKQKGYQGETANTRMLEIESKLTHVQAENLLNAEHHFVLANRGRYTPQDSASEDAENTEKTESSDQFAQRQWHKVQDAQRFSDSPPEPMRINLPTRGLRTTFTKAIQAEVNRPLRLEIEATHEANTGYGMHWAKVGILALSIHAVILWLLPKRAKNSPC